MSLFKKPKRNIRIRENKCSEDADNENDSEICLPDTKNSKAKPHKPTSYSSVLSFGEDLNEGKIFRKRPFFFFNLNSHVLKILCFIKSYFILSV